MDRPPFPFASDDLDTADTATLRARRDDCRAEERRLSYIRRVVQGHLDLAEAEARRRADGPAWDHGAATTHPLDEVVGALTGPGGARSARAVGLHAPAGVADDPLPDDVGTSSLHELDDAALRERITRLARRERALSDRRAVLLGHLDRLQAALVDRYRDGRAVVDDLVRSTDGAT